MQTKRMKKAVVVINVIIPGSRSCLNPFISPRGYGQLPSGWQQPTYLSPITHFPKRAMAAPAERMSYAEIEARLMKDPASPFFLVPRTIGTWDGKTTTVQAFKHYDKTWRDIYIKLLNTFGDDHDRIVGFAGGSGRRRRGTSARRLVPANKLHFLLQGICLLGRGPERE